MVKSCIFMRALDHLRLRQGVVCLEYSPCFEMELFFYNREPPNVDKDYIVSPIYSCYHKKERLRTKKRNPYRRIARPQHVQYTAFCEACSQRSCRAVTTWFPKVTIFFIDNRSCLSTCRRAPVVKGPDSRSFTRMCRMTER